MEQTYYWTNWYSGFGWFLWFGFLILFFSSIGNWGYTYRAHRKYEGVFGQTNANSILAERYARGDIDREVYLKMKAEIAA